jgi:fluoroacetyl-CoA thioesterase
MKGGEIYSKRITVTEEMDASRAVEGVPHVYGTPSLVALIEATAHEALKDEFEPGQTSVGMSIELVHSSPTPIGMDVRCDVKLTSRKGIIADFDVEVFDAAGSICTAKHSRAIVLMDKILAKAERKRQLRA